MPHTMRPIDVERVEDVHGLVHVVVEAARGIDDAAGPGSPRRET